MELTLELLEKHQKETVETLDKEIKAIDEQIELLEKSRDKITSVKSKFISQAILAPLWVGFESKLDTIEQKLDLMK